MASKNVETFRAAHQAFNKRDFDAVANAMTEGVVYHDRARGVTFEGRSGVKQFLQGWAAAFSNAEVAEPKYSDAGNTVIAEFVGRGTNDGPLGPWPKTGRTMRLPFCEIMTFNEKGQIASGGIYYDQLTMMIQLGHAKPAEAAPAG
jgi:steroid delta-isomerase-like uncharacterized protein